MSILLHNVGWRMDHVILEYTLSAASYSIIHWSMSWLHRGWEKYLVIKVGCLFNYLPWEPTVSIPPKCLGCPCEASFKPEDCQRMKEEKKRQRSHCKLPGCPPAGCPVATGKCPSMTFFDYSLPSAGAVEEVMGGLVRPLSRAEMAAPLPLQVGQTFMRAQGGCIHSCGWGRKKWWIR